jgi:NAD(P)-dependent dehydrogenase (short-subunit alcohol dehydrogenase family)
MIYYKMTNKKVALITGSSSGIGKAIFDHLHSQGWEVFGISRKGNPTRNGNSITLDLSSFVNINNSFDFVRFLFEREGISKIDMLVNCAGVMPFDEDSYPVGKEVVDVNFRAPYALTNAAMPYIVSGGMVVNIASVSGIRPDAELPLYSATKAALIALTKSWAKAWAPSIRVNAISPGFYKSNLVPGDTPPELIDTVPMKAEGDPLEIARLVEHMYTQPYLTGSNIVIDGGVSC